jgi:ElaA protein
MTSTSTTLATWHCLSFSELSLQQLYAILQARSRVFVLEQNCPYLDVDGLDEACFHLFATMNLNGKDEIAAYCRLLPAGVGFTEVSIGRVISLPIARGTGLGKELLKRALELCQEHFPDQTIRIGAQHYLEKFYQSFGFVTDSDIYMEDGIPHVEMLIKK